MAKVGYKGAHQAARARLLAGHPPCYWCGDPHATVADHDPPLCSVPDPDRWQGVYRASCEACSLRQAGRLAGYRTRAKAGLPLPGRPW